MRQEALHTPVLLHEVLLPLFSENILGLIIQPLIHLFCNLKPWNIATCWTTSWTTIRVARWYWRALSKYDLTSPMGPTTLGIVKVLTMDSDGRDYYWLKDGNRSIFCFSAQTPRQLRPFFSEAGSVTRGGKCTILTILSLLSPGNRWINLRWKDNCKNCGNYYYLKDTQLIMM